jgi:ABC-type uncharacterized transport system fused permease/ATPase subunit
MDSTLQPRERRALLFGATIIVLMVGAVRGVPAWRRWNAAARASAADMMARAARSDAVVRGLSQSLDTLEARTARLAKLKSSVLTGDTPAEAGSNLAVLIAEAARRAAVRLDAVEVRIDTAKARTLPRIAVDLQATADIAGLAALLRDLEDGPTILAVRRVTVRPQNTDVPQNQVELLSVRLTVEGAALVHRRGQP